MADVAVKESSEYETLMRQIMSLASKVEVVGLGYVGLPLLTHIARRGFGAVGFDLDPERARAVNEKRSYIQGVALTGLQVAGSACLEQADIYIICVPTPLSKSREPDVAAVMKALRDVREEVVLHQSRPCLVIVESTTYPGFTREAALPLFQQYDLVHGKDFFLAFSPERIDPGNDFWDMSNTPKVVGGTSKEAAALAATFYETLGVTVSVVSSTDAAEMVKLLENTYRAVNIGLANEMATMCHVLGLDIWEVIEAAKTKPYGFEPFYPGPGLGGHCIPIDPLYLSWRLKQNGYDARFIELADRVNREMPERVVRLVQDALNEDGVALKNATVLLAGVTYKPNVADTRESPAFEIRNILKKYGAFVYYADPLARLEGALGVVDFEQDRRHGGVDAILILADHDQFDWESLCETQMLVVDTRNSFEKRGLPAPRFYKKL